MNQTTHIMLDLETWGTEPGCDIRSIGACVFDPVAGTVCDSAEIYGVNADPTGKTDGSFYIACDNPISTYKTERCEETRVHPLHRDERTVKWWSEQSDEAQAAFADPVDLRVALGRFSNWLCDVSENIYVSSTGLSNIRLWSHGPAFDPPILAAAYRAVDLPVPWHYRAPRDTRTCFDIAGIDDHSAWLGQHPGPLGIPHHALDDAICQARAVCAAWDRVGRLL